MINAGLEDNDGLIWIAVLGAVLLLDPDKNEIKQRFEQPSVAHVQCITEDQSGNIWLGSSDGHVSVYESRKKTLSSYDIAEQVSFGEKRGGGIGLTRISVKAIIQDDSGQMMIATTAGLVTFDQKGRVWRAFTSENSPLPAGGITALMRDQDRRIWIGTSEGILVLGK